VIIRSPGIAPSAKLKAGAFRPGARGFLHSMERHSGMLEFDAGLSTPWAFTAEGIAGGPF
jgi:hypothetical protein